MLVETQKSHARGGLSANQQALDTQAALLPYALAVFTITLPAYVWAGSHAPNAAWMTATTAISRIRASSFTECARAADRNVRARAIDTMACCAATQRDTGAAWKREIRRASA